MYNLDATLRKFYSLKVTIPTSVRQTLSKARKDNEERLERNLAKAAKPNVKRHIRQGGYAMKTVVQQPGNAYDIDNGAMFTYASLAGPNGGAMSAPDARSMVHDALQDISFNKRAELLTNCVRVYYNDGYWVDVPVYREQVDAATGKPYLEIATAEWKLSDPEGVTDWFKDLESRLSPDADQDGDPQFRRVVAYIKALAVSRTTWNWPNGFMISVLAETSYSADQRDDVSLHQTLQAMYLKLCTGAAIMHPKIQGERLDNKGNPDPRCVEMRDKLEELLQVLNVLDDANCYASDAAKAWDTVFGVKFFRDEQGEGPELALSFASSPTPRKVERGDGGRYG